eukprot:3409159-Rhodomonas_salina.1
MKVTDALLAAGSYWRAIAQPSQRCFSGSGGRLGCPRARGVVEPLCHLGHLVLDLKRHLPRPDAPSSCHAHAIA